MDEFLRDIHTIVFKEWILNQTDPDYQVAIDEKDSTHIFITTDYGKGLITFNKFNIIEFQVTNTFNDEIEFYLHFQMKTMTHALELFHEMIESIKKLANRPILKILLCCSGGLTTSFFASKINSASKLLYLNMEAEAIGYTELFNIGSNYDIILLAPQISYLHAKVQDILKDQIVIKIPPQVFAKYDVGKMLAIMQDARKQQKNNRIEDQHIGSVIQSHIECQSKILSLAILRNSNRVHITYRLYGPKNKVFMNKEIIKQTMSLSDIFDVIDTIMIQNPDIHMIGISIPGIINEKTISSANINGLGEIDIEILTQRYQQKIIFTNDVNAAAVGYYASQNQYDSLSVLFQPTEFFAGAGMIVNGQLITGKNNLAGEVQYLPIALSDDKLKLNKTPEGMIELVSKIILSIISIISPEAIVLFCTLIPKTIELKKELERYIPKEYIPEIIKVNDLTEYCLLGNMILCAQDA